MAIGPRLEQRLGQSLVMTPQLRQAIKLLQLSNLELGEFVEPHSKDLEGRVDRPSDHAGAFHGLLVLDPFLIRQPDGERRG